MLKTNGTVTRDVTSADALGEQHVGGHAQHVVTVRLRAQLLQLRRV